jgi:GTPase SAR1 family protein
MNVACPWNYVVVEGVIGVGKTSLCRLLGRDLVARDDRRDGIADVTHLVATQRLLVLADGQDAELDRQVRAGQDEVHVGVGQRHPARPQVEVGRGGTHADQRRRHRGTGNSLVSG